MPGDHRGPVQRLPPRHRDDQRVPLTGRTRRPARRRHHPLGRGGQRALRLHAGQAHLLRTRLPQRGASRPPGDRGVPHPRRVDQPAVPGRRALRPRLPGRAGDHELHRRAPGADARPPAGRPRLAPAQLPRRRHRQPAARAAAGGGRAGGQAAALRPLGPRTGRLAPAAARPGARALRGPAAGAGVRRGHRHDVPRRPPVPAGHPGAHAGPARRGPVRGPDGPAAAQSWSAGAARPSTSRCGSSPRTRGPGSRR